MLNAINQFCMGSYFASVCISGLILFHFIWFEDFELFDKYANRTLIIATIISIISGWGVLITKSLSI